MCKCLVSNEVVGHGSETQLQVGDFCFNSLAGKGLSTCTRDAESLLVFCWANDAHVFTKQAL